MWKRPNKQDEEKHIEEKHRLARIYLDALRYNKPDLKQKQKDFNDYLNRLAMGSKAQANSSEALQELPELVATPQDIIKRAFEEARLRRQKEDHEQAQRLGD